MLLALNCISHHVTQPQWVDINLEKAKCIDPSRDP